MIYRRILAWLNKGFLAVEDTANLVFSPGYNPFYYLGAIGILFMWILLGTGVYLFIFYKIYSAYPSVKHITEEQWYLGGIIRSLHRYAADGLVIAMVLHMLHVYATDRYRRWRWVAWVTGVGLLATVWITGIIGYWMVWDEKAQMIAVMTAEFLDYIPIWGEPLPRAFLTNELVTGFFFFIILFLHICIPVLLFIILWVHVLRTSKPVINPPRLVGWAIGVIVFILCIIKPVKMVPPADLTRLPTGGVDWFYLFFYPLFNATPIWAFWSILVGGTALLTALPWLIRAERPQKAEVILANCTGCELCVKDCPYEALYMRPRTDGRAYEMEAAITLAKCASCGVCIGSCSFDALSHLGRDIKGDVIQLLSNTPWVEGEPRLLGLVCSRGVDLEGVVDGETSRLKGFKNVKVICLPCIGMVHPSIIEDALATGADGVFISGCQIGDCYYRTGNILLKERLSGERFPVLKDTTDRSRIRVYWLSALQTSTLLKEVRLFLEDIKAKRVKTHIFKEEKMKRVMVIPALFILALPVVFVSSLSERAYQFFKKDTSQLILSLKHPTKRVQECDELGFLREEALKYNKERERTQGVRMELKRTGCSRERFPMYIEMDVDGVRKVSRYYQPTGWSKDGPSFVYEKVLLEQGRHEIAIRMRDSRVDGEVDYTFEKGFEIEPGRVVVIDFDKGFYIR